MTYTTVSNEANVCDLRLSGGALWKLDPLLYLHSRRIRTLVERMDDVFVSYSITGPVLQRAGLPELKLESDFALAVFAKNDSLLMRGKVRSIDANGSSKKFQELTLALGETSLFEPFPDLETLAILVAVSSTSKTDRLTLTFDLSHAEEEHWAATIRSLKDTTPTEMESAVNSTAVTEFLDVVPFRMRTVALQRTNGDYPATLRLTFDTRRIELLYEHAHFKPD